MLGAIGVILTLAYLAIQIRQNTKATRSSVRQSISDSNLTLPGSLIEKTNIAEIFVKSFNEEELDRVEKLQLQAFVYRDLRHWENVFFQMREGLLPDEEWSGFRENLIYLFSTSAYQEYWTEESNLFSEPFKQAVAEYLDVSADYGDKLKTKYAE